MNLNNTESTDVSNGNTPRRRLRWRLWLALVVVAAAAVWFVTSRMETPRNRTEREVRRILSVVRRQDGTSFTVYSLLEAMQAWPQPFPKLAKRLLGPEPPNYEP